MSGGNSAEKAVEELLRRKWTISFAESCTGGMAAAALVDVPNASAVFESSFVTYSNEAKMQHLGVKAESLQKWGAVSETVAIEMAAGAAKAAGAQVGIGITGIAGPTGGTEEKPVGTVCFGFFLDGKTCTATRQFGDLGRTAVRRMAVEYAYQTLLLLLG